MKRKAAINKTQTQTQTIATPKPIERIQEPTITVSYSPQLLLQSYSSRYLPEPVSAVYVVIPASESAWSYLQDPDSPLQILFKGRFKLLFGTMDNFTGCTPLSFYSQVQQATPQYETYATDASQMMDRGQLRQLIHTKTKLLYQLRRLFPHVSLYTKLMAERDVDRSYSKLYYTVWYNNCPVLLSDRIPDTIFNEGSCPDYHQMILDAEQFSMDHEMPLPLVSSYLPRLMEQFGQPGPRTVLEDDYSSIRRLIDNSTLGLNLKVIDNRYVMVDIGSGPLSQEEEQYLIDYCQDFIVDNYRLGLFPADCPARYLISKGQCQPRGPWICSMDHRPNQEWYERTVAASTIEQLLGWAAVLGPHDGLSYNIAGDNLFIVYRGVDKELYYRLAELEQPVVPTDQQIVNRFSDNIIGVQQGVLTHRG